MEIGKWNIPENPGVYLMKEKNKIIYVGKAKNLYKRVKSYFQKEVDREKTRELVKHIDDIEYILCPSELDALLLENNLIKKYNPKYNIALKDEKTYPYLSLSKETFPALHMIRKTKHLDLEHYEYFGPYPFGAWKLKKILLKLFKVRDCFWNMNKKYKRPCLKYDMKTCLGPCVHKEVREEYQEMVAKVRQILKGNTRECIQGLRSAMEEMAETFQFEKAIVLREQIQELSNLEKEQISEYGKEIDEDVFVWKEVYERMFLCVLNVREGKILGKISSNFLLEEKVYENLEEELLLSYYRKYPLPKSIVLEEKYQQVLEEGISHLEMLFEKKIERYFPKIKSRRGELLNMALLNLEKDIENFHLKKEVIEEGMKELYSFLGLKHFPRRIECFDISNIQGKDAVASMSVSIEGKAAKGEYRKFKIQCKDTPDDFAMMREVIYRRYSKLEAKDFPDVILIDGGLGQINSAGAVLEELGKIQFTDLLSLAKRDEEVYKYGEGLPYSIPKDKEALKIFQRVRDEAHRFGITYHRKLRSKRVISSELDTIEGIGEVRKKKLLKKFSSVAGVKAATLEELEECVPKNVAIRIKEELEDKFMFYILLLLGLLFLFFLLLRKIEMINTREKLRIITGLKNHLEMDNLQEVIQIEYDETLKQIVKQEAELDNSLEELREYKKELELTYDSLLSKSTQLEYSNQFLEKRVANLSNLNSISRSVLSIFELDKIINIILDAYFVLTGAKRISLYLWDEEGNLLNKKLKAPFDFREPSVILRNC